MSAAAISAASSFIRACGLGSDGVTVSTCAGCLPIVRGAEPGGKRFLIQHPLELGRQLVIHGVRDDPHGEEPDAPLAAGLTNDQCLRIRRLRCVIVAEAPRTCSVASEIVARLNETCFEYLLAPIKRVTGYDIHFPFFQVEQHYLVDPDSIIEGVKEVMAWG